MVQALYPFRAGTRQRRAKVAAIAVTAAGVTLTPQELPRVGLLSRILVQFRGTVTLSSSGALTDLGPWALANRIQVNANIGTASIVDVSGFGGYMFQPLVEEIGFRPDSAGLSASMTATPNGDIHAAPVASGANTWVLTWVIPVSANSGREFDMGLVNLQAPETRITVNITVGAGSDFTSNFSSFTTANFHVYYEYYEIPDPRQFALPLLALVRVLEEQQPIVATGDNVYTVPRMGTLMQLASRITLNGARIDSPGWDYQRVRFNKTDTVYDMERQWARVWERMWYGQLPLTGVAYLDLWHAASDVSTGDTRDAIDAEELSTLEVVYGINSGATLGSNNNTLADVRRIAQILE